MTDQVRLFNATCFDGWALFTDPIVVSGLLSSEEIAEQRRLSRYTFLARKEAP
jgi:hypothetical protein